MINRFSNLEEIASNLEHFATVLHDQVRRDTFRQMLGTLAN